MELENSLATADLKTVRLLARWATEIQPNVLPKDAHYVLETMRRYHLRILELEEVINEVRTTLEKAETKRAHEMVIVRETIARALRRVKKHEG